MVFSVGMSGGGGFGDPPLTDTVESRLINLIWVNDVAIGGAYIVNYDIHIIDAIVWALGRRRSRPTAKAVASARILMATPSTPTSATYRSTTAWPGVNFLAAGNLITGSNKGRSKVRSKAAACAPAFLLGKGYFRGGASITPAEQLSIPTTPPWAISRPSIKRSLPATAATRAAQRSVDCTLTCILGREAARRSDPEPWKTYRREQKT